MFVDRVVKFADMLSADFPHNAHSRIADANPEHLVVIAQPEYSGRFEKAVPIGEFRSGAYRVTHEISEAWGGLNVKDGFIQRSVCPPWFANASQFTMWLQTQQMKLICNNY